MIMRTLRMRLLKWVSISTYVLLHTTMNIFPKKDIDVCKKNTDMTSTRGERAVKLVGIGMCVIFYTKMSILKKKIHRCL